MLRGRNQAERLSWFMKLLVWDTDDQEWVTTAYHQLHGQLHGDLNDWLNKTNIWLIPDEETHGRPLVWPHQWPWWQCKYVMGILTWPSTCVATRASTCVATHASSNCPLLWASTCSKARASTCVITRASTCVVTRARLLFKNMPPGPSESPYPPPQTPDPWPQTTPLRTTQPRTTRPWPWTPSEIATWRKWREEKIKMKVHFFTGYCEFCSLFTKL